MQVNSSIHRNVHIEIKMTEAEAEEFYKASNPVPEANMGLEVYSLIKKVRESINSVLYTQATEPEHTMAANHTRVRNT